MSNYQNVNKPKAVVPDSQRYFMPGYGGFCPKQSFMIGTSYGNATRKVMDMLPVVASRLASTSAIPSKSTQRSDGPRSDGPRFELTNDRSSIGPKQIEETSSRIFNVRPDLENLYTTLRMKDSQDVSKIVKPLPGPDRLVTIGTEDPRPYGEILHIHPSQLSEDGVVLAPRVSRGSYAMYQREILSPGEVSRLTDQLIRRDPRMQF